MKTFIFLLASLSISHAATISNYSSETNDRFADSSQFVGSDFDFSGVGRTANGRWATLIAPNIFVSANHFGAGIGQEVTFFAGNNSSSTAFSYQVAGTTRIGTSDLQVGHFAEAVDSSIANYDWNSEEMDNTVYSSSTLPGAEIFQLGRSDAFGNLTDLTVGQNTIAGFLDDRNLGGGVTGDFLRTHYSLIDDQAQYYEAKLGSGDSGAPLLLVDGNELAVVGVATAVSSTSSYFTYTGTSVKEVETYIELNGIAVPEPTSSLLISLGLCALYKRRR